MAAKAEVTYDPDSIGAAGVARLIEDLGFGATVMDQAAANPGVLELRVSLSALPAVRTSLRSATAFRYDLRVLRPQD